MEDESHYQKSSKGSTGLPQSFDEFEMFFISAFFICVCSQLVCFLKSPALQLYEVYSSLLSMAAEESNLSS